MRHHRTRLRDDRLGLVLAVRRLAQLDHERRALLAYIGEMLVAIQQAEARWERRKRRA